MCPHQVQFSYSITSLLWPSAPPTLPSSHGLWGSPYIDQGARNWNRSTFHEREGWWENLVSAVSRCTGTIEGQTIQEPIWKAGKKYIQGCLVQAEWHTSAEAFCSSQAKKAVRIKTCTGIAGASAVSILLCTEKKGLSWYSSATGFQELQATWDRQEALLTLPRTATCWDFFSKGTYRLFHPLLAIQTV